MAEPRRLPTGFYTGPDQTPVQVFIWSHPRVVILSHATVPECSFEWGALHAADECGCYREAEWEVGERRCA